MRTVGALRDPGGMGTDESAARASLERQIRFVLEADRLKTVARQSRITDGSRHENSAEHSWHLALMAMALAGHAPPGTDLGRVMAMLVVHDMVELIEDGSASLGRYAGEMIAAAVEQGFLGPVAGPPAG